MQTMSEFLEMVRLRNPHEPEFIQAVEEVVTSVWEAYVSNPRYVQARLLHRMVEPERIVSFRVCWVDDAGQVQVNRGYRVQFNSAIGPYKGGLRFHSSVSLGSLKFLGFEQTFKNSLTSLPMGGGKGGSDFSVRGRSDGEIMRFCQSFMCELFRHIGADTDVPAGDIGVGAREIGYLFGMYKKLRNHFTGVLTGKGLDYGGSLIRPEATGFGAVYFVREMLAEVGEELRGKRLAISGFGNVAWGVALKATQLGARVVALSGPDGYVHVPDGITDEQVAYMLELRASNQDVIRPFAERFRVKYVEGRKPWELPVDIAMPCAIQNEMDEADVKQLIQNGCRLIAEVSNMGCTAQAVTLANRHLLFAPGKAVNAGGVATSGLEMTQNSMRLSWSREEVDARLLEIIRNIHHTCLRHGQLPDGRVDYVKGANVGAFIKVAEAMLAQGIV